MENETKAILHAEDRRRAALVAVDIPTLDELFAEDLVHIHSNARVDTKAQLLRHVEERRAYLRIVRGPLDVRVMGDVAIMTGRLTNYMRVDGKEKILDGMVTQVLRRERGAWRFVNFQLTLGEG